MKLTRWFLAGALLVALVPLGTARRAQGDPIDDKRAEAKALQEEIDANGTRIDALSEQYNGAQYRLEQAQTAIADAQQRLDATTAEVERLQALINERGAALYRGSGQGGPVDLDVSTSNRLIKQSKYGDVAAEHDNNLLKELHRAEAALREQRAQAEQAQADAEHEQQQIKRAEAAVEAANAHQQQLLSQVNGEIAQLVAEEQARKEAEALAAAQARFVEAAAANQASAPPPTTDPPPTSASPPTADPPPTTAASSRPAGPPSPAPKASPPLPPPAPKASPAPKVSPPLPPPAPKSTPAPKAPAPSANVPVSGGADGAIAYARAQVGKPYCYAGAGPSCFDCSGLTMRAWGAAGVSMPHYSGAQYAMFPHVPLNAMQPGDLVFWGPGGSEHVGLYIGGGQMIAAPHTGDVVKVQAVYGSPVGAVRPR